jgi:hypothetical protein
MTVKIIPNDRSLDIRNLEQLPRGTGAPYLEVMESHIQGVYIAVQWRRAVKVSANDHVLVQFGGK